MAALRPLRTPRLLSVLPQSLKPSPSPLGPPLVPLSTRSLTTTPPLHTSVDPQELSHFAALASTWWDPHGSSRLLHLMNPLRHTFISRCHSSQPDALPPGKKLSYLDVGCGGGIFAESAARLPRTARVTAIDPSGEVIGVAKAHARRDPGLVEMMESGRLEYLNLPIEKLPLPSQPGKEGKRGQGGRQYDIVTLFEVLEHIPHPSPFLTHLLPFVAPGGWLVLSTIARTWTSWLTTKVVAEEVLGIVPRGTHDWRRYINEAELREWFGKQPGWESPRAMGVVYMPGLGWREVPGSEGFGNYFFGVRKVGGEGVGGEGRV